MNWEDILWELVQMIETAAPKAWQIATKQVQVMYYQSLYWGISLTLFGLFSSAIVVRLAYGRNKDWYSSEILLLLLLTAIPLIIGICFFGDLFGYSINPEYYAIKALTDLVGTIN